MIFGFNTDVKVGKVVYHVQTEDRGQSNPVIDTTVYMQGRVLAKRGTSYKELLGSPDFGETRLREMLEQQHRRIIDEIRAGTLEEVKALADSGPAPGIQVQLMNPATFLVGTAADLKIGVKSRKSGAAQADADVVITVRGAAAEPLVVRGKTNKDGQFEVQFAMPRLGPGGAELIIQASHASSSDEIRYNMRKKA